MKKILHAIYSANGAPRSSASSVAGKLFLPIAAGLAALLVFMAGGLYWQYVKDYDRQAGANIEAATRIYHYSVTDYQAVMSGIVGLLAADERLPELLRAREADRLFKIYDQTFLRMRESSGLNHLLFVDSGHRVITSLHQPGAREGRNGQGRSGGQGGLCEACCQDGHGDPGEWSESGVQDGSGDPGGSGVQDGPGDLLYRTSFNVVSQGHGQAYTLDVDPDGLLSLLVVVPIYSDGELAGFIEAGMALERALRLARQPETVEILLALDKDYINQERVSLAPAGGQFFWQDPGGGFLLYTTFAGATPEFNRDLRGHFEASGYSGEGRYADFSTGGTRYAVSSQPLFDSSGALLGGLLILNDITPVQQEYYGISLTLLVIVLGVATAVYYVLRRRLRDTDNNIASLECAIEDGELLFENVFSRSDTGFIMRDLKKGEALKANDVAMNACSAESLDEVDVSRLKPVPADSPVLRRWGTPLMTAQYAGRRRYFEVSSFTAGRDCVECTTIREVTDGVALLLEESQARKLLHSILWQLPGWICIKDSSLRLLHSNRSFRRIFFRDDEADGLIRHSEGLGAGLDKLLEADREALLNGRPVSLELALPAERGERVYAVTSQRFIGRNGEKCVLSFGYDITERARMTEQITELHRQAERAIQAKIQFIAHMSHEMRTPMHTVLGMIHLALGLSSDARISEYLNKIQSAAQNLTDIINGILDLVQLEAGDARLHRGSFDLSALLDEVEIQTLRLLRRKHVEFIRETPNLTGRFIGDVARLRQVLLILCGNAVKFTEEGWIRLTGALTENDGALELHLSVEDSGIGIAQENLDSLFDGFYQVDGGLNRKQGGIGLGLALAKLAIELMGGRLEVSSELGKGSRFSFTIKLQALGRSGLDGRQAAAAEASPSDDQSGLSAAARSGRLDGTGESGAPGPLSGSTGLDSSGGPGGLSSVARYGEPGWPDALSWPGDADDPDVLAGASILVVEDNTINQEIILEVLKQAGARAVAVSNGQAALDILQSQPFDLTLMDLQMPVMDGLEAARRIRAQESKNDAMMPIIALTANAQDSDRLECAAAGMNDFMSKPLDVTLLYAKLRQWLSVRRRLQQNQPATRPGSLPGKQ